MPINNIASLQTPFPGSPQVQDPGKQDGSQSAAPVPRNQAFDRIQWDRAYAIPEGFQPQYNPRETEQYQHFTPSQGHAIIEDLPLKPYAPQQPYPTPPSSVYPSSSSLETSRRREVTQDPGNARTTNIPAQPDSNRYTTPRSIMEDIRLDVERHEAVKNYLADPSVPPNLPTDPSEKIEPYHPYSDNPEIDSVRWTRDWNSPNNQGVTSVEPQTKTYYGVSPAFYNAPDPLKQPLSFGNENHAGYVRFGLNTVFEDFPVKSAMEKNGSDVLIGNTPTNKFALQPTAEFYFRNKYNPYATESDSGLLGFLPPFDLTFKSQTEVAYQNGQYVFTPKALARITSADYQLGSIDVMGSIWGGLNQSSFTGSHFIDSKNSLNALLGIRTDNLLAQSAFYGKFSRQWNNPTTNSVADTEEIGFVVGMQGILNPASTTSLRDTPLPLDLNQHPLPQNGDAFFFGNTSKLGAYYRNRDLDLAFNNKFYSLNDQRIGAFAEINLGDGINQDGSPWGWLLENTKIIPTLSYNFGSASYFAPGIQFEKTIPAGEGRFTLKIYYERDTLAEQKNGVVTGKPGNTFGINLGYSI